MTQKQFSERIKRFLPILTLLAFILFFVADVSLISFFFAITPEEALEQGLQPIPVGWEAGVPNHGSYYRWFTIAEHPILFGVSLLGLIVPWFFIIVVGLRHKDKLRQFVYSRKNSRK